LGVGYALGHKRTTTTDRYRRKIQRAGDRVLATVSAGELLGDDSEDELAAKLAMLQKTQSNRGDRRGLNPRQLEPQRSEDPNRTGKQGVSESAVGVEGREKVPASGLTGNSTPKDLWCDRGPALHAATANLYELFSLAGGAR
jgi:hypothetical protein